MGSGNGKLFLGTKGGCFISGTLILTENGLKVIEEIQVGDYVYSKDVNTGKIEFKKVIETFVHTVKETICFYLKDSKIETTLEHPFWIYQTDWKRAEEIKAGDLFTNKEDFAITVEKTEKNLYLNGIKVYNFHVEDFHTYYVSESSVLVHNSSKKESQYKKPTSGSGKEKSTDVPKWAKGQKPFKNESGKDFAKRLMDMKYGKGNYRERGNHEFSSIKKWGDRGFE